MMLICATVRQARDLPPIEATDSVRHNNASNIGFDGGAGPELSASACFHFTTFGLNLEAEVMEYVPSADGQPARVAWRAWIDGSKDQALDVLHAWLIEDLPGARVRVLTQESQIGTPAREMAHTRPKPMLHAHQNWLEGLVRAADENVRR